jgi:hypothetical protein
LDKNNADKNPKSQFAHRRKICDKSRGHTSKKLYSVKLKEYDTLKNDENSYF